MSTDCAMFTDGELAGMVAAVTATLSDTGTITRPGVALPTFNTSTGLLTPSATTVVYTGPCRVQPKASASEVVFGEQQVSLSPFVIVFPNDATGVQLHDIVTVTVSDDPDVLTRQFIVVMLPLATFSICKAFGCEVVST